MDYNEKFCQSCGMPLTGEDLLGTNADGSKSEDYCNNCYEKGQFTSEMTMEEMIEFCIPHLVQAKPGMTQQEARKIMQEILPTLKRWK